jgi:hypothetical protein
MSEPAITPIGHVHRWYVGCRGCAIEPDVSEHFVTFDRERWTMEHSLHCRMDGDMQAGCPSENAVTKIGNPGRDTYGRWRIVAIDSEGLPLLERAEVGE